MSEIRIYAILFLMKHRTIHYVTVTRVKEYRNFNVSLYFILVTQDLLGKSPFMKI